jgi:L-ascorbate metabolism protein UlaG (beta-lactamase superfamily)
MSVRIVYHGHSNLEIHSGSHRIQLDPFYDDNALADCKAADVSPTHILLSHAHSDHSGDVVPIAKRTGAPVASNFEITNHYLKKKLDVVQMNHGGGVDFPFGRATYTIAFHTSSWEDGSYAGEPGGWVVETGGKTIYFAGDTALFGDMRLIGELWNIDLACLPIGDCFTMGPAHAIRAAEMLKAKAVLPIHYNTFPPIKQDPHAFARDLERKAKIQAFPLKAGETVDL